MLSTLLRMGSGVIMLPLLVRSLPEEDLGFWYLMGAAGAMAMLVDFGFSATTLRSVASLHAGAFELLKDGQSIAGSSPNWVGIICVYQTMRVVYNWVCLAIVILYLGAIMWGASGAGGGGTDEYIIATFIGIVASVFVVLDANLSAFLAGLGGVVQANKIIAISQFLYLILSSVALVCGGGIVGLAASNLIHAFIRYCLTKRKVCVILNPHAKNVCGDEYRRALFSAIWPNTWRYGLMCIGGYLIISANTLIVSSKLGLATVSSYGLTQQILGSIAGVSGVFLSANLPTLIKFGIARDFERRKKLFWRSNLLGIFLFSILGLVLIFWGDLMLRFIGSRSVLLSRDVLMCFVVFRLLEFNHSQFASLVVSQNNMPFLLPAIVSGIAIVIGSVFFVPEHGVLGAVLVVGVVQLLFNNWYPVVLGLRALNTVQK